MRPQEVGQPKRAAATKGQFGVQYKQELTEQPKNGADTLQGP